jgi:general stress protein YciG
VNCCSKQALAPRSESEEVMPTTKSGAAKRGFAAMDPAKQREIASKGGKASHGGGRRKAGGTR